MARSCSASTTTSRAACFQPRTCPRCPSRRAKPKLLRRLDELTAQPFDLESAPLFRAHMFRLAPDEHVLFFMPHHIVWDGWSFDLLYTDFAALYRAARDGHDAALPALRVSYGDFAAWHEQWLHGEEYAAQWRSSLSCWRERLQRCGAPTPLPIDRPREAAGADGPSDTIGLALPAELTEALRAVAQGHETTLYVVLIAAFGALLQRLCDTPYLTIGTPVRVRGSVEVEPLMGLFTNLLPLALDIPPATRFDDCLAATRRSVLAALASPDVQIEDLLHEPDLRNRVGDTPFYQAQFSFQDARQRVRDWGGLEQTPVPLFQRGASEELAVWLLDHGAGMLGGVVYRTDLIEPATARMLAQRYRVLLERIVEDARQPVAELTRISDEELAQVRGWSAPQDPAPMPQSPLLLAIQVTRGDKPGALHAGSWSTGYAEIEQRANRLAACLVARGVGRGDAVALAATRGANRIAAVFAILRIGATAVLLDPAEPVPHLRACLSDAGVTVVVAESTLQAALEWPAERSLRFDVDAAEIVAAADVPPAQVAGDADDIAIATYATDTPVHGTGLTRAGLGNLLDHLRERPGLDGCASVLASAGAGSAWSVLEGLLALGSGLDLVQANRSDKADGGALRQLLERARAPLMFAPAGIWRDLLDAGWNGTAGLKAVCIDAPLSAELAAELLPRCAELWTTFGGAASMLASDARLAGQDLHAGRPVRNARVCVLDAQGQPCPPGVVGALYLGGAVLNPAFGRNASASPPPRRADPVSADPAAYLIDSGRRGRWRADGHLELLGSNAAAAPAPASEPVAAASDAHDVPRSAAERWLTDVWKELLGVPQVLLSDNFFDLGGHSLLAMEMVTKVEKRTRVRLNLLKIASSTLRALAAELPATIDAADAQEAPSLGQRMRNLFGLRG